MTTLGREERLAAVLRRQHGRISRAQLSLSGVPNGTVAGWTKSGYLTRVLPRVYAVGHTAPSQEADLWAAVLHAGPGAMLSHASAAHHRGWIDYPPRVIQVSTARAKIKSIPGVVQVHPRRELVRASHDGIPTTTIAQTVLDLAATQDRRLVGRALAVLDFRNQLDIPALEAICGSGKPGSSSLHQALAQHQPALAYTNGKLERSFLRLCERFELPIPKLNPRVCGEVVDAYWPEHGLVVEVDGLQNHSSPAQLRKDRRKELKLRAHGLVVVRYDWDLVTRAPEEVYCDLQRQLAAAR